VGFNKALTAQEVKTIFSYPKYGKEGEEGEGEREPAEPTLSLGVRHHQRATVSSFRATSGTCVGSAAATGLPV
jgi:hypothetical protein